MFCDAWDSRPGFSFFALRAFCSPRAGGHYLPRSVQIPRTDCLETGNLELDRISEGSYFERHFDVMVDRWSQTLDFRWSWSSSAAFRSPTPATLNNLRWWCRIDGLTPSLQNQGLQFVGTADYHRSDTMGDKIGDE